MGKWVGDGMGRRGFKEGTDIWEGKREQGRDRRLVIKGSRVIKGSGERMEGLRFAKVSPFVRFFVFNLKH